MAVNKSHRVLVVGLGSIGERHLRCLLATGRAEVGICEPNDELRRKVASSYAVSGDYDSLDLALDSRWDSAVIATPAHTHIPISRQIAGAGIAPLVEKPLAVDEKGLAELTQEIEQAGLTCGVAYVYRAHPTLKQMREAIVSGRFGKPLQVITVSGQHFPTYRPAYAATYYNDHAKGGGLIQDMAPHMINAVEWLVGPMTRVAADCAHLKLPNVEVEDTTHVIARHGRVMAAYAFNQHQAPNETSITVVCEKGTCRFELQQHRWGWMAEPDTPWQYHAIDFKTRDDWFTAQETAWLDACEGKSPPLCSLTEAWQTLRSTRAVLQATASTESWIST